ncbi:MAG: hypothetical protein EWV55_11785 [Microcystis viridis Mv_BB_P_19951000_S69]|uniref:Uncharacterized protein n=1 Tax=Microcystis viridis Mv_BB_P_19951000_S68D TaxID=2486270 RepID=A0A552H663_MICVR|nr:MAG: hypothetical protein EWV77_24065 [Microcystis viridis Mv_BB_P_19951000_S68D]TRU68784.1 MAG: hypothetical protein EWV47_21950 [Microcystis viridis Mv_BB_P_19951000_S68]TRU74027.1 MAG: hypothetical protein EWV55_11785 [Microcystis viridis Mv_BB_P_19951000_S69]TRU89918.1 MAG: hypothetical protein EWV46_02720 [Microcystis viridis Mv_BB_P_19951000_S69D]
MGRWGSGEVGKWGSGGISTKTLTPQHPKTLSPYHPITRLLTSNPILDKDKQKLFIDSKNLRIFKLTFRNIYKFLTIN